VGVSDDVGGLPHEGARSHRNVVTAIRITRTLDPDRLETVPVERAASDDAVSKCGRCFDGGGY
jgi:hypothetical protein